MWFKKRTTTVVNNTAIIAPSNERDLLLPYLSKGAQSSAPDYYAHLDWQVRRQDGKWTVTCPAWNLTATHEEVEVALLIMWRAVFRHGNSIMASVIGDDLPKTLEDEAAIDGQECM